MSRTPSHRISGAQRDVSADRFETIINSINDGVFTVNRDWQITCFNQAAERITGVPREKAIGRHCSEVLRSNVCKKACPLMFTIENGRPIVNLEVTILDAADKEVPISISTALLKNKQDKIVGGVETFRDLTLMAKLRKQVEARYTFEDIISKSPNIEKIFNVLPTIAKSDSTVLIQGESGTGKELVARAIHNLSPRRQRPFIVVNCVALPDTLVESELFGYKAGAFTNANKDKPGRFALAEGGTIFLDEIGDMTPNLQAKILRVLQERVYEPLGGTQSVKADVRIVVATNRDLPQLVEENQFRVDLYYRINVIQLEMPALRERMEDLPLLVDHFIAQFSGLRGKDISGISARALGILMKHDYPGNVRELQNIIEHAFVLCPAGMILVEHLPDYLQQREIHNSSNAHRARAELESRLILEALKKNDWNRLKAAKDLGIHKSTLFRRIRRLGIKLPAQDGRSATSSSG
jgi:PAS domain S-box-containing protein